jgi:hypothetical protein
MLPHLLIAHSDKSTAYLRNVLQKGQRPWRQVCLRMSAARFAQNHASFREACEGNSDSGAAASAYIAKCAYCYGLNKVRELEVRCWAAAYDQRPVLVRVVASVSDNDPEDRKEGKRCKQQLGLHDVEMELDS